MIAEDFFCYCHAHFCHRIGVGVLTINDFAGFVCVEFPFWASYFHRGCFWLKADAQVIVTRLE